jgi:hypothetical protein
MPPPAKMMGGRRRWDAARRRAAIKFPWDETETAAPKRRRHYLATGVAGRVNAP